MSGSSPWVRFAKRKDTAEIRLFCFPYAGGGATAYRRWSEHLASEIEVFPVQIPGREERLAEPLFTDAYQLAEALTANLRPFIGQRRYAFYGHSLGALLAFEVARALRRQGAPLPVRMIVAARVAPQDLPRVRDFHTLPDEQLVQRMREYGGTPSAVLEDRELLELFLPIIRADFQMHDLYAYRQEPPFEFPIDALYGRGDEHVSRDEVAAWEAQTRGPFSIRAIDGDHFFLSSAREATLQAVSSALAPDISPHSWP